MSTTALDVVSTSMHGIGEIDHPVFAATQVMARPSTNPMLVLPVLAGGTPDVEEAWAALAETAEFFGYAMPTRTALADALTQFLAAAPPPAATELLVVNVTVVDCDGVAHVVVTGGAVPAVGGVVRIDVCDPAHRPVGALDPQWRRMAARTTSRAETDQLRLWLQQRGCVDAVSADAASGAPFLGALIFGSGAGYCGVDGGEPTSILDQLERCGAHDAIPRVESGPADAERAWWISPEYSRHPVAAIGDVGYAVDVAVVPEFARLP